MDTYTIDNFLSDCNKILKHERKKVDMYTDSTKTAQFAYVKGMERIIKALIDKKDILINSTIIDNGKNNT